MQEPCARWCSKASRKIGHHDKKQLPANCGIISHARNLNSRTVETTLCLGSARMSSALIKGVSLLWRSRHGNDMMSSVSPRSNSKNETHLPETSKQEIPSSTYNLSKSFQISVLRSTAN